MLKNGLLCTCRVMLNDVWSSTWLNQFVEIWVLVTLGLTCFIFFYSVLIEVIYVRCAHASMVQLQKLYEARGSYNRKEIDWSKEGLQNSDNALIEYFHPIALRR